MKESLESLKKAMKYVEDHPPCMDKEVQDALKRIVERKRAFRKEAKKFGLVPPKGVLLVGAPGTNRSFPVTVPHTRPEAKCPKCKTPMQLISTDAEKNQKTHKFEVKHRWYCNKCRKPHFVKLGEYE